MPGESAPKPRLAVCAKCRRLLQEPPGYDVFKCGGCGTTLQAKKQKDRYLNTESSTQETGAASSSSEGFSLDGASEFREPSYIGGWRGLVRIELVDNKICELPQSPEFPKLKVLFLQGNVDLMDIPESFFNHMPLLQHLDLSNTSIRDLPLSISKLTELITFYLRSCDLFLELPPQIGQLKKLVELDLDDTLITHLPIEVRKLINLQRLILCFDGGYHSSSTIIPPGVISNLTLLKYLSINVDPEDDRWNENNVANILVEISGLMRLETACIHLPEAKLLELISARKSLNFRLVVGHYKRRFISRITPELEQKFKCYDHCIKFVNGVDIPNGVNMNLERCKALYLDRHVTIKSLADFELMSLQSLEECILAECNEMETIVDGRASYSYRLALPRLESLAVFYMKNLRSICERPLQMNTTSFLLCSLKSMSLHTCPMLITIFSISFIENLSLLEELIVEDCPKVTTLISHDSSKHETNIFLPRLRKIWLLYLPELINIFNGLLHVGQSLQVMGFYYCPKLQSLSKTELSSQDLRVIKGESRWWETLKWNEAEWGDAGQPNFLKLIFSPINVESDIMVQLAAHHDVDEDQLRREREIFDFSFLYHPPSTSIVSDQEISMFEFEEPTNERSQVTEEMPGMEASSSPPRKGTRKNDPKERTILVPALQVGNKQIPPEDGFTWRKYGQKALPGTKYPRREAKSRDQLHMAPEVEKYHREKPSLTKRHYRPVAGGAPFVTCPKCLKLLQLPADFLLFKRVCHQLKCGACQEVLKFSLQNRSHIVSYAPNALGATSSDLDDQNRVIGGNNPHSESHVNSPNADHISYSDDYGYSSSEEDPFPVTSHYHRIILS